MADFGIVMSPTDYAIQPAELARAVEARGFESLFFPEHTHIPVSRKTPFPLGGPMPEEYAHNYDPFVALTAAAGASSKLKLATGICLVVQRDPIVLAKEVASLDRVSGGRLIFGVGGGWLVEELASHGVPYRRRFDVLREKVLAMKEIWTKEVAEFHGEFVNFEPMWSGPKPVQRGGPPIILGGDSVRNIPRVVDYCDGWMPHNVPGLDLAAANRHLREMAKLAKRSADSISLTAFRIDPDERIVAGLIDAGCQRIVLGFRSVPRDEALRVLDSCAKLAAKFR
jgi:probable F420-dependent oxidoreductase